MDKIKILTVLLSLILFLFFAKSQVYAIYCNAGNQFSGSITVTVDCNFQYPVDGVDLGTGSTNTGTITVQSGVMTVGGILGGQTIAFGSMFLNGTGSVSIDKTVGSAGELKPGAAIYTTGTDADIDGYTSGAGAVTATLTSGGPRRNSLTTLSGGDCCDTDNHVHPGAGMSMTSSSCAGAGGWNAWDLNCDGTVTKSDNRTGSYSCTNASNPGCDPCNRSYDIVSAPGWDTGQPGCGGSANWVSCSRAVGCWTAVVENCGDVCTGSAVYQSCN